MKNIFIITGVSGAGKSTVCKELEKVYDFPVKEFDADGVPSDFTTLQEWVDWRVERTDKLITDIIHESDTGIICGSVIPCEFWKFNITWRMSPIDFHFCLLDCDEVDIRKRLEERKWNKEMIEGNVGLSSHLKWEMLREFDGLVVNTSQELDDSIKQITKWIALNIGYVSLDSGFFE